MDLLGPSLRRMVWDSLLQDYTNCLNNNRVIPLYVKPDSGELVVRKERFLPVTLSLCQESREYTLNKFPDLFSRDWDAIDLENDILLLDYGIHRVLTLEQTAPLLEVAGINTVAIHWRLISDNALMQNALMIIFSRLRTFQNLLIVVRNRLKVPHTCYRNQPLSVHDDIHPFTLLTNEGRLAHWTDLGYKIRHEMTRKPFWRGCNNKYRGEGIPRVRKRRLRLPSIDLVRLARGCTHETSLCIPRQSRAHRLEFIPPQDQVAELQTPRNRALPFIADFSSDEGSDEDDNTNTSDSDNGNTNGGANINGNDNDNVNDNNNTSANTNYDASTHDDNNTSANTNCDASTNDSSDSSDSSNSSNSSDSDDSSDSYDMDDSDDPYNNDNGHADVGDNSDVNNLNACSSDGA